MIKRQMPSAARALDPNNLRLKLKLVESMAAGGDIEGAVKEFRRIEPKTPEMRLALAQYLILLNRQRPKVLRELPKSAP